MVSPSRRRRLSAYAVPGLALVALGFVAVGVRIGDGAIPLGSSPRSPAPAASALSRPAAQITAESSRTDAAVELAAAIGAIGELGSSRSNPRPAADSPAAPGTLPAPLRSPQSAPAPGTSPPTASPPGDGPGPLDPPPAAGGIVEDVEDALEPLAPLVPLAPLGPLADQTAALTDPLSELLDPMVL